MNLNMIRPKNEIEDLLLSITNNSEKLVEQTHRKPKETLEFKMIKSRETFRLNQPFYIEGDWMIELIDLEVYNSIFNITKENNKFEFHTHFYEKLSLIEIKDELEEFLTISEITDDHLQEETKTRRIIEAYKKLRSEKTSSNGYLVFLMYYATSPFRDIGSFLRKTGYIKKDDIQLFLKQYNAFFVTYELDPGNYTIEDLRRAVYPLSDHEGTLQIECDVLNKKTKLILTRFGSTFGALRFEKKSFFHTLLKFEPYWDYKPTNANLQVYTQMIKIF